MKRLSSVFNNKKGDKEKHAGKEINGTNGFKSSDGANGMNGTNGVNGSHSSDGSTTQKGASAQNRRKSSLGFMPQKANLVGDPSDGPDHSVNREGFASTLNKYAQSITFSARPMPTETGDGAYITEPEQTGLWDDLKAMRIKDFDTLDMTLKQELSSTKLTDDRSMLMERTIQVTYSLRELDIGLTWPSLCLICHHALRIESSLRTHLLVPYMIPSHTHLSSTRRQIQLSPTRWLVSRLSDIQLSSEEF